MAQAPEARKAYMKQYQLDHAEEIATRLKQYSKQYRADHAEKIALNKKQYQVDHAEKIAATKQRYYTSPRGKFTTYNGSAKKRDIVWNLTFEQFCSYWQKPCHYCSAPIETIGLDRYNSDLGYFASNVVPCCAPCNSDKHDMHGDDFIQDRQADIDLIEANAIATGRL